MKSGDKVLLVLLAAAAPTIAHGQQPGSSPAGPGQPALYVPWPSATAPAAPTPPAPMPAPAPLPAPAALAVPALRSPGAAMPVVVTPQSRRPGLAAPVALPAALPIAPAPAASVAYSPSGSAPGSVPAARPIAAPPIAAPPTVAPPVARPPLQASLAPVATPAPPSIRATIAKASPPVAPAPDTPPAHPMTAMAALPSLAPIRPAPATEPRSDEGIVSHAFLTPTLSLSPSAVETELAALQVALRREVPGIAALDPTRQERLLGLAQATWRESNDPLDRPQLAVVVDRNPRIQQVAIVLARPDGPWQVLGATHVSTGQAGRFDHYITPTGVFLNTADILGYRAEGTYNENHIRGLGVKGMRVWDFGWQTAHKGWQGNGDSGEIRLEMHATDPEVLAQRIGSPASQGCVRIPDAFNRFLDRHGVIDADYERAAVDDVRYRALLLSNRTPTPLAGNALIIVDSGGRT